MSPGDPTSHAITLDDRVAMQRRPTGTPIMRQNWGKLLFLHWRFDPEVLRPHIPAPLSIDTFEGHAYVALTPFTLWNVRPKMLPPLPWLSQFHELNVRTYVYYEDKPGVWFFSLDANRLLPVLGARTFFRLPYFSASIEMDTDECTVDYSLARNTDPKAVFDASWTVLKNTKRTAGPGSLEFFLAERYCLYTESSGSIYRARIHHEPWPLFDADLHLLETDLFTANRLPEPTDEPLVHAGGPVHVDVWALEEVAKVSPQR